MTFTNSSYNTHNNSKFIKNQIFINIYFWILIILPLIFNSSCSNETKSDSNISENFDSFQVYFYRIINTYPHDSNAFTQGLIFEDGFLFEGTGLRGNSSLRKVELETGNILKKYDLPDQLFGEGITIYKNKIIQLIWKTNVGFVYSKKTFKLLEEFTYPTEGWGITHDENNLIMSDGTSKLYFLTPETFETMNEIEVYDNNGSVDKLNELEYIKGYIYANVWGTNLIAIISPKTGQIIGRVDLKGILTLENYDASLDVLNGIAFDKNNNRLFVTGKLWPKLFEIELIP